MRYCNGCGEQIKNQNIFCPHCGFKQIKTADESRDSTNFEEAEKIKEDSISKIEEDPIVKPEIISNVQNESSKTLGIILVGILIFIGAVYFSTSNSNNTNLISSSDSVAVDLVSGTQGIDTSEVIVSNRSDLVKLLDKKQTLFLAPRKDGREIMTRSYFGDLNGDGIEDALVEWALMARGKELDNGGGNANISPYFLRGFSVYLKIGSEYVLKADKLDDSFDGGGLSNYTIEGIENGKIICSTLTYADGDPRCCPSLKETIYLLFQNNEILLPIQVQKITTNEN